MKILVTGVSGMVGSAVKEVFEDCILTATDKETLDVRFWDSWKAYLNKTPDLLIHLAAETDLERCETNPDHAYMTNHTGALNAMLYARELDIPMVYISTAGVFNGQKFCYHEWDIPDPVNHYGRSKLYGEMALKNYDKVWIFRAGWMMGGGPAVDKKFVNKVFALIQQGKKMLYGINDIYGSPTYAPDLVKTIRKVIDAKAEYGLYNSGGAGRCSRYDVQKTIVETLGLQDNITCVPVKNGFFQKDFFCTRSVNEAMENTKLNAMGLSCMRNWKDSLIAYIRKDFMK